MTFMEQVFALFAVISVIGTSVIYWRTHHRRSTPANRTLIESSPSR